jgi:hypothetical protein
MWIGILMSTKMGAALQAQGISWVVAGTELGLWSGGHIKSGGKKCRKLTPDELEPVETVRTRIVMDFWENQTERNHPGVGRVVDKVEIMRTVWKECERNTIDGKDREPRGHLMTRSVTLVPELQ